MRLFAGLRYFVVRWGGNGYEKDMKSNRPEVDWAGKDAFEATILVVDDKPTNIKLLFDALKGSGYRTLAALWAVSYCCGSMISCTPVMKFRT